MAGWIVVFEKSLALFLVMALGAAAALGGIWRKETSRSVSTLLIDIVFPCYVLVHLLRTVDGPTLRREWFGPLLGFLVIALGHLVGAFLAPLLRNRSSRPTFVFLVAMTNWIYLPLPIAEALFGGDGVRAILLINVGAQVAVWTLGIAALKPGLPLRESVRAILANPGILATFAGLLLAIGLPPAQGSEAPRLPAFFSPLVDAVTLLGTLTIPLSLLLIGSELGLHRAAALRFQPALWGVLAARLLAVPFATVLVLRLLAWPWPDLFPLHWTMTLVLVSAMPPAISCILFTERFGGDSLLSSQAVFGGTLAGLVSVPALFALGGWLLR